MTESQGYYPPDMTPGGRDQREANKLQDEHDKQWLSRVKGQPLVTPRGDDDLTPLQRSVLRAAGQPETLSAWREYDGRVPEGMVPVLVDGRVTWRPGVPQTPEQRIAALERLLAERDGQ